MFRVWIVIVVDDKNGLTYRKLSIDGLTVYPNIKCLHLCLTYSSSLSSMWSYLKLVRGAGAQISQKFHLLPQNGWLVQKVHFWGPTPLLKILLMGLKLIEDCIKDIFQMIDMIVFLNTKLKSFDFQLKHSIIRSFWINMTFLTNCSACNKYYITEMPRIIITCRSPNEANIHSHSVSQDPQTCLTWSCFKESLILVCLFLAYLHIDHHTEEKMLK